MRRALVLAASAALAAAKKPLMPKCEDQADDIGASICQAMLAVGFYTCEKDFCPTCEGPHAGVCNLSCDYCPTYMPTVSPSSYTPTTQFAPSYLPTRRPTRRPTAMDVTPTQQPSYEPSKAPSSYPPSLRPTGAFPTHSPTSCHNAADHALGEFTCAQWLASDGVDCSSVEGACALSCDECGPTSHPTMRYDMNSRGHPTYAFDGWRLEGRTEPPAPSGVVVAGGDASYFVFGAVVLGLLVSLCIAWRRKCIRDRGYAQFGEVREERAYEMPDAGLELSDFDGRGLT